MSRSDQGEPHTQSRFRSGSARCVSIALARPKWQELLATKRRALLQRNKGRDLFDLDHAFTVFTKVAIDRVV